MAVAKAATGIAGFDYLSGGGLPRGGTTVVLGDPGAGKTLFSLQASRQAVQDGASVVYVTFEECADRIAHYAANLGWQAPDVRIVDARLPASAVISGEFDLGGLFATLTAQLTSDTPAMVVLDGVDVLLSLLSDPRATQREMFRVRDWFLDNGAVGVVTAKAGKPASDQFDFLPFLADCLIYLRHDLSGRASQRTLQISKYRGSSHSSDEHAFAITSTGLEVPGAKPPTPAQVSNERVSTGVASLDEILGGGIFRGSSVLLSGAPGTAKSTLAAAFAEVACRRGEKTLYVAMDETQTQVVRNMRSVGIDLQPHVDSGLLTFYRPASDALSAELHAHRITVACGTHAARNLVVDPISALTRGGSELRSELGAAQIARYCRQNGITLVNASLTGRPDGDVETTPLGLSTIADTWIHLSYVVAAGERNRGLSVVKSRGSHHSNQVRELLLGPDGIRLADVYTAGGEVLMGTLRWEKEQQEREKAATAEHDHRARLAEVEERLAELALREDSLRRQRSLREQELTALREEIEKVQGAQRRREKEVLARRRGESSEGD